MTDTIPAYSLATRSVHLPHPGEVHGTPVSVPIYQTSTFVHDDAEALTASLNDPRAGFGYSRMSNPTVRALEDAISALEGGVGAVATASGMGAIATAVGALVSAGGHLVVQRSIYGGTAGLFSDMQKRWGVTVSEVPADDPDELAAALRPETAAVYLETISNPMTGVADIPAMAAVAGRAGVITVVDNTFASPMLCRPLSLGADIVLHSTTKYLGGHSDVTGGIVVYADDAAYRAGWSYGATTGFTPDPFAAWLTLRGSQTLGLRVRQACGTATVLADRLAGHPAVAAAHHPSLPEHPQHALAGRLLDDFGAMMSIDLAGGESAARTFTGRVRLIKQAASLGGVETLLMHPASSSHRMFSDEQLAAAGISRGTVRISVGIEDCEDLWADLAQALDRC